MSPSANPDLPDISRTLRLQTLRMISRAGTSHVGSCFSIAEILAVLYWRVLRVDPARPDWSGRDRFILSKGHAAAILYAALAERGFFPVERLDTFCRNGSHLAGHVSHRQVPGVEVSTGSLGHGLPVATGMALNAKRLGQSHRVVALLSDGECDEGSVWESALVAAHHGLDGLTVVVDYNKIQSLGTVESVLRLEPFSDKWRAFGWAVRQVDGHDPAALSEALCHLPAVAGQPTCVIAHTCKGKGVSFMEDSLLWHYRTPQGDEFDAAMRELEGAHG